MLRINTYSFVFAIDSVESVVDIVVNDVKFSVRNNVELSKLKKLLVSSGQASVVRGSLVCGYS